jgi:hypothetical protein
MNALSVGLPGREKSGVTPRWFLSLADAKENLEHWRRDCNQVKPHNAIGNKSPTSQLSWVGADTPPMSEDAGKSNHMRGALLADHQQQPLDRNACVMLYLVAHRNSSRAGRRFCARILETASPC